MPRLIVLILVTVTVAVTPVLYAHHSVAGQFDMSREVVWEGVITGMDWINPHTYIYLEVTGADGNTVTWKLESVPTAMLRKAGLTKAMIMGDGAPVTVTGLVARDGTKHLGYLNKITYPNGHFYEFSRPPR